MTPEEPLALSRARAKNSQALPLHFAGTTLVAVADATVPGPPRVFRYVYQHGSSANAKRAANVALSALRCQLLPGAPLALAREVTPAP